MKYTETPEKMAEDLIAFEKDIAWHFDQGEIRAPVHLAGGNEKDLIHIFKEIHENDWVCGAWRTHYHCLLKGVPPDQLRDDILAGKSITLCYPEYKIISSAIAGGIIPIALGLAWSIRNHGMLNKVWCFIGDMTLYMGVAAEATRYASGHDLPIRFIVEDNGKSVYTPTQACWGEPFQNPVMGYKYDLPYPHSGAGTWVRF